MAIRNMAIPLFGGGALLLGFAAFSWLRAKRAPLKPTTDTLEPGDSDESDDAGWLSERSPRASDSLELEGIELPSEREPSLHDSVAPEDIGAQFLARATDALSPFGSHAGLGQFELEQFAFESGMIGEATARAANGEDGFGELDEPAPESERRPSFTQRTRGRS